MLDFTGKIVFVPIAADAPGAVAAHLAQTAVGVVKAHAVIAAAFGGDHQHQPVGPQGAVLRAEATGQVRHRLEWQAGLPVVEKDEVVSGSVHFGKSHGCVKSAPESGEGRDELLLSGHHTGQEEHVVFRLHIEGLTNDLRIAHIKQMRAL